MLEPVETILIHATTPTSYVFPTHGECVLLNLTIILMEHASIYSWDLRTGACSWNSITCGDSLPCCGTLSHTSSSALTLCPRLVPSHVDCMLVTHKVTFRSSHLPRIHHCELCVFLTIFICSFVNFNITHWYSAFSLNGTDLSRSC